MKKPNEPQTEVVVNQILDFLEQNRSLSYRMVDSQMFVEQSEDLKTIQFDLANVERVLSRADADGSEFIQINFKNSCKILMTKSLIGFKPVQVMGFDSAKIPKVVTTVDLKSISQAIEDLYESDDQVYSLTEIEVLKKVYQSILVGAESVGFDMRPEKEWFSRHLLNHSAATA